jgi:hypothetical protein
MHFSAVCDFTVDTNSKKNRNRGIVLFKIYGFGVVQK